MQQHFDLFIIGGGINGCGIAADAALRGLKVILCEQDDLARYTSSYSSKLIHGGLRYLEYYEFNLVRKALHERERLLKLAPHLIHPLPLILPHNAHCRPSWMIRLGLFLYDALAGRHSMPRTKFLKFNAHLTSLKIEYTKGYLYYDGSVDDSRLVIANALQAQKHGALIHTHSKVISAQRQQDFWQIEVDHAGTKQMYYSKALINAAGPWVNNIITEVCHDQAEHHVRLVKGSHIVVKRPNAYHEQNAYILQLADQRIIFVIPYYAEFLLIGTTDIDYQDDPALAQISTEEVNYLLEDVNEYFTWKLTSQDIVHTFSGVRPLVADTHAQARSVTRDYKIEIHDHKGHMPVMHIFGGKITTYRKLAEEVVDRLQPYFLNLPSSLTHSIPLPGGDLKNFNDFVTQVYRDYPRLPQKLLLRYAHAYGTRLYELLQQVVTLEDLGPEQTTDLYQREIDFLKTTEWAKTLDDILWRRTKLGLIQTHS
jgi:glycerol-3-phosphate dehydrogenase